MFLFLLLLLCDDDDDDDFAIVTEEEDDDNFAIVVVFKNVVLLTLPLPDGSPFCVNRVLFSVVVGVMLMVVTDNMLMFSYLFIRACVYWCVCVRYVACKDIKNWWSRWIEKEEKNEGKKQKTEKKKYTRERERERERHFYNISLLILLRRRMYAKKIRAASRVIILL